MQLKELKIQAPAKVNLFLAVRSRRPDGYHELETLMQKLELADELELSRTGKGIRLVCPDSSLPEDETNLAHRAAALFLEKTAVAGGVKIRLIKPEEYIVLKARQGVDLDKLKRYIDEYKRKLDEKLLVKTIKLFPEEDQRLIISRLKQLGLSLK